MGGPEAPTFEKGPRIVFDLNPDEERSLISDRQAWLRYRKSDSAKLNDRIFVVGNEGSWEVSVAKIVQSPEPKVDQRHIGVVPDADFLVDVVNPPKRPE